MDPASAFGLVASVLALVQCGLEVASKCVEVSREGSLKDCLRKAETTNQLLGHSYKLQEALRASKSPGRPQQYLFNLQESGQRCDDRACTLLKELERLEEGPPGCPGVACKSARALLSRRKIKALQQDFEDSRQVLDKCSLIDLM